MFDFLLPGKKNNSFLFYLAADTRASPRMENHRSLDEAACGQRRMEIVRKVGDG